MARKRPSVQLSVPQLFNEAQRVNSVNGLLRYTRAIWELFAENAQATYEQLISCVRWVLKTAEVASLGLTDNSDKSLTLEYP